MKSSVGQRAREILEYAQANPGISQNQIAAHFNCTKQYVSLIFKLVGEQWKTTRKPKRVRLPSKVTILRWLRECGYFLCNGCKLVHDITQKHQRYCLPCNAKQFKDQYHSSPTTRQSIARWRKENPEKVREHSKAWALRNPEKVRANSQRNYKKRKADSPEKLREYWRLAGARKREERQEVL